jgi:hypothetical protein
MQDSEGGVVGAGDDGEVLVRNDGRRRLFEDAVFGNLRRDDETRQSLNGCPHLRA